MPKCVVTPPSTLAITRPQKPRVRWQDTTLYETHLRGFTMRHPSVPELERGTFAGFSHRKVIEYIKALGVTSVEILPVHQFIDENFLAQKGLHNYWGYNTLSYFATHAGYQLDDGQAEFRQMVDCYHEAGWEVILDVVYNHTGESNHLGPTLSFRGIDNASYYHLQAQQPRYYVNDTGCGNTVNAQHPAVMRLILDSLRYWSKDMGVDGFRFDLATTLGRKKKGFSQHANVFQAIAQDPELNQVKLIAEPWDIGPGGYQLGKFPSGWSEWNDSYRDVCRKFWRREAGVLPTFARRIHGSSDVFEHSGKNPYASVNFITSHDGFTLNDLVSYKERHNLANGESNRDGHGDNISQNFGVEGPTDDPEINQQRQCQMRNMLATLLLSQGVPMIRAGDELGQSQHGNNNAYCQDNELSWLDWSKVSSKPGVLSDHGHFVAKLIQLARDFPMLRNHEFLHAPASPDGIAIQWLNTDGQEMRQEHWAQHQNFVLGYKLTNGTDQSALLVIFSNDTNDRPFTLPSTGNGALWQRLLDSNSANGESTVPDIGGDSMINISASSVTVLGSRARALSAVE
jgi:glycogen operon protein